MMADDRHIKIRPGLYGCTRCCRDMVKSANPEPVWLCTDCGYNFPRRVMARKRITKAQWRALRRLIRENTRAALCGPRKATSIKLSTGGGTLFVSLSTEPRSGSDLWKALDTTHAIYTIGARGKVEAA